MNIVVLQDFLRSGGTERQSVLLADAFAERGHDTTLLRFRPGGALESTIRKAETACLQSLDTHLDWFAPGLDRRLRQLEADVILCMGRMANCHAGSLQKALPRSVVVSTMRTGKALPWLFRRSLRLTRHTVANSRDARQALIERYGLPPAQVSVINNSIVFRRPSTTTRRDLRAEHDATPTTFVMLSVAMFRREKRQAELIELCTLLPKDLDWQLWLAGDGPCLAECVKKADDLNLSKRIRFLGWSADPSDAYAAANVAVHASVSEALSNFLIEAQSHGLPCVAYEAQGNGECMEPGRTGFIVRQGDRPSFIEALLSLAAENNEARQARSQLARSFARNTFNESRQIQSYLDLFESLLNPRKSTKAH
jgi:glycosyltransferase involved in cell wall biosynthesis